MDIGKGGHPTCTPRMQESEGDDAEAVQGLRACERVSPQPPTERSKLRDTGTYTATRVRKSRKMTVFKRACPSRIWIFLLNTDVDSNH